MTGKDSEDETELCHGFLNTNAFTLMNRVRRPDLRAHEVLVAISVWL